MPIRRPVIAALAFALAGPAGASAGTLAPPAGPVAPTMRTLEQINPGVPISQVAPGPDSAHLITQAGRYYLDQDVVGGMLQNGIRIDNPGGPVVIDGNGFSVIAGPDPLDGIRCDLPTDAVRLSNMFIKGWSNGILVDPGNGQDVVRFEIVLEKIRVTSVSIDGIGVASGDRPIELLVSDSSFDGGGGSAIHVNPELTATQGAVPYVRYKLERCFVKSWSTSGIDLPPSSGGTIERTIVEDTGFFGMRLGDDARLDEIQIFNAGTMGLSAGLYIAVTNSVIELSGNTNFLLGDGAWIENSVSGSAGVQGMILGNHSHLANVLVENNDRAVLAGRDLVARESVLFGALETGSYLNLKNSVVVVDLDSPTYRPSRLLDGLHTISGCEFDAHGNSSANLPFVRIEGPDARIRDTKFLAADPQPTPLAFGPEFVRFEGDRVDCQDSGVYGLWSACIGIDLLAGTKGHIVRNCMFVGDDAGTDTIGIEATAVDGKLIVGNNFTQLGGFAMPVQFSGTGIVGAIVTSLSSNPGPDRNLHVP